MKRSAGKVIDTGQGTVGSSVASSIFYLRSPKPRASEAFYADSLRSLPSITSISIFEKATASFSVSFASLVMLMASKTF
jgi:hypothetical protein